MAAPDQNCAKTAIEHAWQERRPIRPPQAPQPRPRSCPLKVTCHRIFLQLRLESAPTRGRTIRRHWAVSNQMKRDLATRTLNMAIAPRLPPKGRILHRKRGSQYCSHGCQTILRDHASKRQLAGKGIATITTQSKPSSRPSKPSDQAQILGNAPPSRDCYLSVRNGFYNPRRRHSALGLKSPVAFERKAA